MAASDHALRQGSLAFGWASAGVCLAAGLVALVCLKLEGLGLVTMSFVFGIPSAAGLFTCKSVRGRLEQRQSVRGFPVIMKEEAE